METKKKLFYTICGPCIKLLQSVAVKQISLYYGHTYRILCQCFRFKWFLYVLYSLFFRQCQLSFICTLHQVHHSLTLLLGLFRYQYRYQKCLQYSLQWWIRYRQVCKSMHRSENHIIYQPWNGTLLLPCIVSYTSMQLTRFFTAQVANIYKWTCQKT